jgi:heptosyltransferase-1
METRRLLIVRLSSMGDVIHALPAATALRAALPGATIGWVIEERWAELLRARGYPLDGPLSEQKPLVDRVHLVRTKQWRRRPLAPATWTDSRSSLGEIRRTRYDVAMDFQGSIRSAVIARWSGAPKIVGFSAPRESPARWFYKSSVQAKSAHVIEQNLELVSELVSELTSSSVVLQTILPRDPVAEIWCDRYLEEIPAKQIVLLNPGAGWGAKQWPAERYGAVARELGNDRFTLLINHGPGEEKLAQAVADSSGGAAQPVLCSLAQLIALTRRASLFIGGDTGPLHLAAALQVPVVAIFGPTDPARNGPFGTQSIVLRDPQSVTSLSHRAETEPGLLRISTGQALAAARELLGSTP